MRTINGKRLSILTSLLITILGLTSWVVEAQLPYVPQLTWSVDGNRVAIVLDDRVEVRDATTSQLLYTLSGHKGFIPKVAWSPDNTMIATASDDQTVKVWNASDGALVHNLTGHNEPVTNVWWSPDSTRLISSGFENRPNLFVWNPQSGSLISEHNGGSITDGAFSPDGRRFAIVNSLILYILDSSTFEILASSPRVACCANIMYSLSWSEDGSTIGTGSVNGLVTLWNADTAQMEKQFIANPHSKADSQDVSDLSLSWVRDVVFAPGGQSVRAVSGDGTLKDWNIATGALVSDTQIAPVYTATWSPYSGRLAVLSANHQATSPLNGPDVFEASSLSGVFDVIVPAPSLKSLQAIALACKAPNSIKQKLRTNIAVDQLSDVVTQIEALPVNSMAPACADELIAVSEALQAEPQR